VSKQASFAATITLTSSGQGEQSQIDIGPYLSANVNAFANGAASTSPGQWLTITKLANGNNNINVPFYTTSTGPLPMMFVVAPLQSTAGVILTLKGALTDVGVQVSSVNPSFIPAQSQNSNTWPAVIVATNASCQLELGWI
jgi:hypothetical protein